MAVTDPTPTPTLADWLHSPLGQRTLAWEQAQYDERVDDVFGYHALQLGLPELDTLRANRMPHRWVAQTEAQPGPGAPGLALAAHAAALPFSANSLDLITLPHTLELSADPHQVLREVERVLVPEGRVVITCFNPYSLWGVMRTSRLPPVSELLSTGRLKDWLKLLSLEPVDAVRGGYALPATTQPWLDRSDWMERWGPRAWPPLGGVYLMVAVKRVHGMRLLGTAWKPYSVGAASPALTRKPVAAPPAKTT